MIKNIKVTNKNVRIAFCDTTNGNVYSATEVPEGGVCPDGIIAIVDGLSFKDDIGGWVSIFEDGNGYEVVEEINNDWNTEDWDEIPEDVDVVVTFENDEPSYYKMVDGRLQVQCYRSDSFDWSGWSSVERAIEYFGDRFHLRPSPITEPTPEVTESTQVESSEVEATTTPEFDWSSAGGDVEAVVLSSTGYLLTIYKHIGGGLHFSKPELEEYKRSFLSSLESVSLHLNEGNHLLLRPPATKSPEVDTYDMFKGIDSKPSIYTILQEAQQSILKHHGVTGKVKFTVTCS